MATADQIKQLLVSHFNGDNERFSTTAMQIAAHEARRGKGRFATDLKKIISNSKVSLSKQATFENLPEHLKGVESLLSASTPTARLSGLILSEQQQKSLFRVVREVKKQTVLQEHYLEPRRKLLLYGASGTGKTSTAVALAGDLKLPLYAVRFDSLLTKYMGEAANKLRQIFDFMNESRGVYLFDEFDSIGTTRLASNDVGEVRRVLNTFLQLLDQDKSQGMIIAATNLPETLDIALYRRFDDVIEYHLPTINQIKPLIENVLYRCNTSRFNWNKIEQVSKSLSHAAITRACHNAIKETILDNKGLNITQKILIEALKEQSDLLRGRNQ